MTLTSAKHPSEIAEPYANSIRVEEEPRKSISSRGGSEDRLIRRPRNISRYRSWKSIPELSAEDIPVISKTVRRLRESYLLPGKPWAIQPESLRQRVIKEASDTCPVLKRYEDAWPVIAVAREHHTMSNYRMRTKYLTSGRAGKPRMTKIDALQCGDQMPTAFDVDPTSNRSLSTHAAGRTVTDVPGEAAIPMSLTADHTFTLHELIQDPTYDDTVPKKADHGDLLKWKMQFTHELFKCKVSTDVFKDDNKWLTESQASGKKEVSIPPRMHSVPHLTPGTIKTIHATDWTITD
ncbi:hypothetical protein NM688_g345 [Phlebia brevispora]|uniref:Uncharacterized protein n=1 Tax=Phlebia brevispora TaxID=194682 RepID=A0ACC1TEA2_9APHY|nr:hypothetical protein NM688_g345 [Phlebia brevispora]